MFTIEDKNNDLYWATTTDHRGPKRGYIFHTPELAEDRIKSSNRPDLWAVRPIDVHLFTLAMSQGDIPLAIEVISAEKKRTRNVEAWLSEQNQIIARNNAGNYKSS